MRKHFIFQNKIWSDGFYLQYIFSASLPLLVERSWSSLREPNWGYWWQDPTSWLQPYRMNADSAVVKGLLNHNRLYTKLWELVEHLGDIQRCTMKYSFGFRCSMLISSFCESNYWLIIYACDVSDTEFCFKREFALKVSNCVQIAANQEHRAMVQMFKKPWNICFLQQKKKSHWN